jgi:hypothetical protein
MSPALHAASPTVDESRVLPSTLELERRTQPWCPNGCAVAVPFVAIYRRGIENLVFVGVRHAFDTESPTMRAVTKGFAEIRPAVVILEGFPTAMGEDPPPLVQAAHQYGAADADAFTRGEAMYAASLALARGIPFLGGEPTQEEQFKALKAKGFTDADLAFDAALGCLSQALRSGDIADTSLASLENVYPRLVENVREQTGLEAPTLDGFRRRYQDLYGVDVVGDEGFPLRIDVGDSTRHGQQNVLGMMVRDLHLLELIERQLTRRRSVLVVYGGSHWSTLSQALEQRLGKPRVKPFID